MNRREFIGVLIGTCISGKLIGATPTIIGHSSIVTYRDLLEAPDDFLAKCKGVFDLGNSQMIIGSKFVHMTSHDVRRSSKRQVFVFEKIVAEMNFSVHKTILLDCDNRQIGTALTCPSGSVPARIGLPVEVGHVIRITHHNGCSARDDYTIKCKCYDRPIGE